MSIISGIIFALILGAAAPFLIIKKIIGGAVSQTQLGWPAIFMDNSSGAGWAFNLNSYLKDAVIFAIIFLVIYLIVWGIRSMNQAKKFDAENK